jgi:hypothetical protein
MNLDTFRRNLAGDGFTHLLDLHRLQQLLVGFKLTLGVHVVLGIKSAADGFLLGFVLHHLDTLQPVAGQFELGLQGGAEVDHALIELALHVFDLLNRDQHGRVEVTIAADPERIDVALGLKVLRIEIADDVVRKVQAGGICHQLIAVILQQAADLAFKLDFLLLDLVVGLQGALGTLVFIDAGGTVKRVRSLVDDALGAHDGGEHLALFLDLVLLVADRLVEFVELSIRVAGFDFGAVGLVSTGHLIADIAGIHLVGVAHPDRNQVGSADVLGVDDSLENPQGNLLVHVPAVGELEVVHHFFQGVAALDLLELRAEKLRGHAVGTGSFGHADSERRNPGLAGLHLDGRLAFILLGHHVGDDRGGHEHEKQGKQDDAVTVLDHLPVIHRMERGLVLLGSGEIHKRQFYTSSGDFQSK